MKAKILRRMMMVMVLLGALVGLLSAGVYAAETVDSGKDGSINWALDSDGVLTIEGNQTDTDGKSYGSMNWDYFYALNEKIPWYNYRSSIKSVVIKQGVYDIGYYAFDDCAALTSVTLPDSVIVIRTGAFRNCTALTNVTIPGKTSRIGPDAFSSCRALKNINIPSSVTEIGEEAFSHCTSLTQATVPASVTSVGNRLFCGCSALTDVTIECNLTSIGTQMFDGCSSLTKVNIPDSVTSIGEAAFSYCSSLTNIKIPNGVTSIGKYAFMGCESLSDIDIPSRVRSFGEYVFWGCTSLSKVTIPERVTQIEARMFDGCTSLTSIIIPDGVTEIDEYAFNNCDKLSNVYYFGSADDWENIQIGWGNDSLEKASFTYNYCIHTLTQVAAKSATCTEPGYVAHWKCSKCGKLFADADGKQEATMEELTVTVPHTLTKTEEVPSTCTETGVTAYWTCEVCGKIFLDADGKQETDKDGLVMEKKPHTLTKTEAKAATYQEAGNQEYWTCDVCGKVFSDEQAANETTAEDMILPVLETKINWTLEDGVLTISGDIPMDDFSHEISPWYDQWESIQKIVIREGIQSIGDWAFEGCANVTEITIPASVTAIGENAFSGCTGLKALQVAEGSDSFTTANGAVVSKDGKRLVVVPAGIAGSYEIPGTVTTIADNAFAGCGQLENIYIPSSVTAIGDGAFSGCNGLKNVYYEGSSSQWSKITIGAKNEPLTGATIYYDCASSVVYLDENGAEQVCYTAKEMTYSTKSLAGWYVVRGNVTISSRVMLTDNVNLILTDGATLTVSGMYATKGRFHIYGQKEGTGKLVSTTSKDQAAIYTGSMGIYGGVVEATGTNSTQGYGIQTSGSLTIYNSTVKATGGNSGFGYGMQVSGHLDIQNSEVTASSNYGTYTYGANVRNGVTMKNSTASFIAGDGSSRSGAPFSWGLQVKGDVSVENCQLTVKGGEIGTANGYSHGLSVTGGSVTINGGTVKADASAGTNAGQIYGIYVKDDTGTCTVTFSGGVEVNLYSASTGLYTNGTVTVKDTAKLHSTGGVAGIQAGELTVSDSAVVEAAGKTNGSSSYGIYVNMLNMDSGTLSAQSASAKMSSYGISAKSMTVNDGTVTSTSGDTQMNHSAGIYISGTADDAFIVAGGKVTATAGTAAGYFAKNCGIYAPDAPVSMLSGTVIAKAGEAKDQAKDSYGIYGSLTLFGGKLQASGSTRALQSQPDLAGYYNYYWRTDANSGFTANSKSGYVLGEETYMEITDETQNLEPDPNPEPDPDPDPDPEPDPDPDPDPTPTPDPDPQPPKVSFADVPAGKYYSDAVSWAVAVEITNGTTATTFSPDNACNRGQIVVFLWRLAGKPIAQNRNNPFTDVKEGSFCYEAVLWAAEQGITTGKTATTFCPGETCNRGQIVTFLWRYAGKPAPQNQNRQFVDVAAGSFCDQAVMWAVENQITLGVDATHFNPTGKCTRGHAVTFLYRGRDLLKK